MKNKKLATFFVLFLILILLRDIPYINIFIIDKVWIAYSVLLFAIFLPRNMAFFFILAVGFIMGAFLSTLIKFPLVAEIFGVVLYVLLWIVFINTVVAIKKRDGE